MASSNPEIQLDPKYDNYDYPVVNPDAPAGHPGHTTKEQDAQVHQLRSALEAAGYKERLDTLSLLRFLRARKFNVEASKAMYVATNRLGTGVSQAPKLTGFTLNIGSSTARNGGRNSRPTNWCGRSTMSRNPRFSNTIPNITTKLTRYIALPRPGSP